MKKLLAGLMLIIPFSSIAQQTMGLFLNDTGSFNGYTLMAPMGSDTTYLIDNCGRKINSWASENRPGLSAYLLPNGDLIRTAQIQSNVFQGGGAGGRLEQFDWAGNLVWEFNFSDSTKHQHHDIAEMPNGNVLVLAWEYRSAEEAEAEGRLPGLINGSVWPTYIAEIEKVFPDQGIVVWEWRLWDHLVQNVDPAKPNFDVVSDRIERFNVNQVGGSVAADWMHCNTISYNELLDQIVISSRKMSEIYVIDHSTTSSEAASSLGGTYGRGGDILYRWGNPEMYDRGDSTDQRLNGQHDIQWIPENRPGGGNLIAFSNQHIQGSGSAIIEFIPEETSPGFYQDPGNTAPYGPIDSDWEFTMSGFFSGAVSGCQRQPNGTTLITQGSWGRLFEVENDGTMVWDYINPIGSLGPQVQGTPPVGNSIFKVRRYGTDYEAFDGRDLTPGDVLELNPLPSDCEIHLISSVEEEVDPTSTIQFGNNSFRIISDRDNFWEVRIIDGLGRAISKFRNIRSGEEIHLGQGGVGINIIQAVSSNGTSIYSKVLHSNFQ